MDHKSRLKKQIKINKLLNISKRKLTQIKTDLLVKGLNFSITSRALLNKDIVDIIGF